MTSPFQEALRAELMAAARRDLGRRRRGRLAGALAAASAAVAGSLALLWPSPAAADVEVRFRGDEVEVRIVDLRTDPDEVRSAMREAGLAVDVQGTPTGPSAVGRFVSATVPEGGEIPVTYGSDGVTFDAFVVQRDYVGTLVIVVGVPASGDELYGFGTDALAPGEPLACQALVGRTVSAVPAVPGVEVQVLPLGVTAGSGGPIELDDPRAAPFTSWYVTEVRTTSRRSILVLAAADPVRLQDAKC